MEKILVIADPIGGNQEVIARAIGIAQKTRAELLIVGFVYEHIANLPDAQDEDVEAKIREKLVAEHRKDILKKFREAKGKRRAPPHTIEVHWEKRVAEWVIDRAAKDNVDVVMKRVHRSETLTYTPTDWQLLRSCKSSVLLVAEKHWKQSNNILAAVDLGTRSRGKRALNEKVVSEASQLAKQFECKLIVGYALPISRVLRDLDILDERKLLKQAKQRLDDFCDSMEAKGIAIDDRKVVKGEPQKALVNAAAKSKAALLVLGCVGRRRLAGRVIGNTAEQILRLSKADVLAVKPS